MAGRREEWATDEEYGRQFLAGENPCTLFALKQLPSQLGSAIGPQHVDGGCLVSCCHAQTVPAAVYTSQQLHLSPAAWWACLTQQQRKEGSFTLPMPPPPLFPAEELKALGAPSLEQLVAEAASGGKPRLYWADYWMMDAFWGEGEPQKNRAEHAGRCLLFLVQ